MLHDEAPLVDPPVVKDVRQGLLPEPNEPQGFRLAPCLGKTLGLDPHQGEGSLGIVLVMHLVPDIDLNLATLGILEALGVIGILMGLGSLDAENVAVLANASPAGVGRGPA